jgi:hypothetical protein
VIHEGRDFYHKTALEQTRTNGSHEHWTLSDLVRNIHLVVLVETLSERRLIFI